MKYPAYFLLIAIVCGVSVGLAPIIQIYGQAPQILFLLALVWSLNKADRDFLFVAVTAGLFLDFYSGSPVGAFSLPLLFLCLIARLFVENFLALELSPKFLALLLLPAQILFDVFYVLCSWLLLRLHFAVWTPSVKILAGGLLPAWLYNLLLLYPIVLLVENARALVQRYFDREFKTG